MCAVSGERDNGCLWLIDWLMFTHTHTGLPEIRGHYRQDFFVQNVLPVLCVFCWSLLLIKAISGQHVLPLGTRWQNRTIIFLCRCCPCFCPIVDVFFLLFVFGLVFLIYFFNFLIFLGGGGVGGCRVWMCVCAALSRACNDRLFKSDSF